ncbi:MAG: aspartate kinase [Sphaerochaetaceae bacterium]|nr:aspartate kinase [Sphaerochaetaceae bacterium]
MIVCKFGGTSLCDASQIKKVSSILNSDSRRSIVIVSAPGKRDKTDTKVTDMLYNCHSLAQRAIPFLKQFDEITFRFTSIAKELGVHTDKIEEALNDIAFHIEQGVTADYVASRGEFLNALLISEFLGWELLDAAQLIVINEDGSIDENTYHTIAMAIDPDKKYVFPGFYGSTKEGEIKTFSRGGSDITGSIVARSVGAELYENWTDVSGIFMADPRIISDAKVIDSISYREVRELAAVGFNVFHEEAIAPVRQASIPIRVKNTNRPEDQGTVIVPSREASQNPLAGVTVKTGYCRLSVEKLMLFKQKGIRERLENTLHTMGVFPELSAFNIDSIIWFFPSSQVANGLLESIASLLNKEFALDDAVCETGFALAAVVGEGFGKNIKKISHVYTALQQHSIHVVFSSFGISKTAGIFVVSESQAHDTVKVLYEDLLR